MNASLAVERISRPRFQAAAVGTSHVPFWTRLTLLFRLFLRAKETSLDIEGVPAQRRRDVARLYWWPDGVDD